MKHWRFCFSILCLAVSIVNVAPAASDNRSEEFSTPEKRLAESNPPGWPIRVSRIGNDFSIRAIDEDDHRFQSRLTEEHLVSEDESVFENFSVIDLDKHRAGDTNRNFAAVRERRSRSDYQISAMLKTNPGRTGSPLILVGFSKHSTGCPGR